MNLLNKPYYSFRTGSLFFFAFAAWTRLVALAQEVAPGDKATNNYAQLPEVIVTAQKEPTALQRLPLSDTAVTRETLETVYLVPSIIAWWMRGAS